METAHAFGREGEKQAERFLRKNGYIMLCRNFRPPVGGEVDLVCRKRGFETLVFVEVKTRRNEDFGQPSAHVDEDKRRRLILSAQYWLSQLERADVTVRFDVVEVILERNVWRLNHIVSAFTAENHAADRRVAASPGASRGGARPRRGCGGAGPFHRRRGRC